MSAGQPQQQALLDVAGVLILVADQVPNAVGDRIADAVIFQEFRGPPLQVIEIRVALIQEQIAVTKVAPAQGDVGTDPRNRSVPRDR